MKIAVIGTGGVGGYFGGRLARAGNDVTFLARGEHLRAIQQQGLTVKSIKGDFKVAPVKATDCIKNIGSVDLIIIAVKAWQISEIGKELAVLAGNNTMVMPLQNGVSAADELQEQLKQENIIGGLCRIISKIESPGIINHFGIEPTIIFGELDNSKTERIRMLKAVFDNAEISARISDDIIADLWKKFIPICVSGLLAVTKTTYGELRQLKETRQLMMELLDEIFRLSQKIGIRIKADFVAKAAAFIDKSRCIHRYLPA
jgi:2-dehydropantoate 2-reductase